MAKAKHTPGPWRASQSPYGGWHVESMGKGSHPIPLTHTEANVRLQAAAPELLAACEQVYRWLDHGDYVPGMHDQQLTLLQAISKAKGESS